ncbi:hypothetical protein ElyMa_000948900 [Elysia marginata]|uniref:Uncharacterized protein n=1 Tax=Elysia marginata TaxID=1093978 RepID=A0AAV4HG83_9GAST|nr:hypothetical protein ElyMa_000948900 [Elysia marginata]
MYYLYYYLHYYGGDGSDDIDVACKNYCVNSDTDDDGGHEDDDVRAKNCVEGDRNQGCISDEDYHNGVRGGEGWGGECSGRGGKYYGGEGGG